MILITIERDLESNPQRSRKRGIEVLKFNKEG